VAGIRIAALSVLALSISSVFAQAQVSGGPKAESRMMRLDQAGAGLWAQPGHAGESISHVTLGGNPSQQLGLEFTLAGGRRLALGGTLEHKDTYSLLLKITHSGDADASGSLLLEYGAKHSINTLFGSGLLDGKAFAVQFSRQSPLQMNVTAMGTGSWSQSGTRAIPIQRISCLHNTSTAEAAFFLADGRIRRVSGRALGTAGRSVRVEVSNSGTADASGELIVRLDRRKQIASVGGEIKIDGQPIRVRFEATTKPAR